MNNILFISQSKMQKQTSNYSFSYLDLPFDEGGNIILVLEDGECLQQVMFQPLPVLCDFFPGGSCRGGRRGRQSTQAVSSQKEHRGVMFQK